ncbi:MAG: MarR family transcriptional regulator [Chromatiales bacterium]|jgi:MarR family transcriptional regulator, lower aerobic nicotinate degradation pathway regulator|nr:MarR family transcriptional regulator [Chromatiales bacterium]
MPKKNKAAGGKHQADDGDEPYQLDDQVGHLLRRANQRHTALFAEHFAADGLTTLQFAALMKLAEWQSLSQNQLGRLTAMDPNTIQGVVKRLASRGLLERQPNPDDRRRITLILTEPGKRLCAELAPNGLEISRKTLDPLNAKEREQLLALLRRIT